MCEISPDTWFNVIGTILATFVGGWAAVKFQLLMDHRSERKEQHQSALAIQFELATRANALLHLNNEYLATITDESERFKLPPYEDFVLDPNVPLERLEFLLERYPDELFGIRLAVESYSTVLGIVGKRNDVIRALIHQSPESVTQEQRIGLIKRLTDALYRETAVATEAVKNSITQLHRIMKGEFPEWKALTFHQQVKSS